MKFDRIADRLLSFDSPSLGAGATDAEIESAATSLHVPIRGGFRAFLARFGHGGVADFDLYGVGGSVPPHLDLIRMTQSERTEMEPNIPPHLLPIMNNGAGDHACLDTRASPDEPPVVMWYHEDGPDQVPEQVAPDFVTWLAGILDERESER